MVVFKKNRFEIRKNQKIKNQKNNSFLFLQFSCDPELSHLGLLTFEWDAPFAGKNQVCFV